MRQARHALPGGRARAPSLLACVAALKALLLATVPVHATESHQPNELAPRQRLDFNEGWRFHLGDPDGNSAPYLYDVLPAVQQSADGKVADAMPEEATRVAAAGVAVLKPWILPSGNAFIQDPARRHAGPPQDPTIDAPFARAGFDDRAWRAVRLPHDWAIEGPFLTSGPPPSASSNCCGRWAPTRCA